MAEEKGKFQLLNIHRSVSKKRHSKSGELHVKQ
jgi:hypothetical protein